MVVTGVVGSEAQNAVNKSATPVMACEAVGDLTEGLGTVRFERSF